MGDESMPLDLLTGEEFSKDALLELFELTKKLKAGRGSKDAPKPLWNKSIGMIFAKSSTRTRVSFEVGVNELGGHTVYMDQSKTQMGRGETIADTARVLSRYLHGIVIRTYSQSEVEELAEYADVPVINALTDDYHPCQAYTDFFTILEHAGKFDGIKMAYLGDGSSNMANSLIQSARVTGICFDIASPEEYKPREDILSCNSGSGKINWTSNPAEALENADFIYTDVWVSMGFEEESKRRIELLSPYQLDMEKVRMAKPGVKILHCLPAHRGEEITDEVMESGHSIVFDQAENRLHVQKAILCTLIPE